MAACHAVLASKNLLAFLVYAAVVRLHGVISGVAGLRLDLDDRGVRESGGPPPRLRALQASHPSQQKSKSHQTPSHKKRNEKEPRQGDQAPKSGRPAPAPAPARPAPGGLADDEPELVPRGNAMPKGLSPLEQVELALESPHPAEFDQPEDMEVEDLSD